MATTFTVANLDMVSAFHLKRGKIYPIEILNSVEIIRVENPVKCDFPSPAQDYLQTPIDLNEILISNETSTFIFIADGDCMLGDNIPDGALLVVDRSITAQDGHIVLARLNGEFTLKRLDKRHMTLMPSNPAFDPIVIKEGMELFICGVVTNVIIQIIKSNVRLSRL